MTVHQGTAVWLRRRPLHPVKPACVLGPDSSGTVSTILAGPPGALGFTGELAADLLEA